MELSELETKLEAAIARHDLLTHPFYQAWSMGQLTLADLRAYAAEYQSQVDALPALLASAALQSRALQAREALARNLAEELGAQPAGASPHRELWLRFAEAVGASRQEVAETAPAAETRASGAALATVVAEGEIPALAALWAYERQTARVAKTKREGLCERYGVKDAAALSFFTLHETLDVHHAADLLAAVSAACEGDAARIELACAAASRSAQAQWQFLDGVEDRRTARA